MTEKAKKLSNEPINPVYDDEGKLIGNYLTKREYFAGLAMAGSISIGFAEYDLIAMDAVGYADALLEELSKTE